MSTTPLRKEIVKDSADFSPLFPNLSTETDELDIDNLCSSNRKKRLWTKEEDEKLKALVKSTEVSSKRGYQWTQIAKTITGRSGKQCRERWHNHLRPELRKGSWTPEEDRIIVEMQAKLGNQWKKITKHLPGRTDNDVKNRFHSATRHKNKENVGTSARRRSTKTPMNSSSTSRRNTRKRTPFGINSQDNVVIHERVSSRIRPNTPELIHDSYTPTLLLGKRKTPSTANSPFGGLSMSSSKTPAHHYPTTSFFHKKKQQKTEVTPSPFAHQTTATPKNSFPTRHNKGGGRNLPRICSDVKSLKKSYGILLSPVRKVHEDVTLAAKKVQRMISFDDEMLTPVHVKPSSAAARRCMNRNIERRSDLSHKANNNSPVQSFPSPIPFARSFSSRTDKDHHQHPHKKPYTTVNVETNEDEKKTQQDEQKQMLDFLVNEANVVTKEEIALNLSQQKKTKTSPQDHHHHHHHKLSQETDNDDKAHQEKRKRKSVPSSSFLQDTPTKQKQMLDFLVNETNVVTKEEIALNLSLEKTTRVFSV